MVNLVEVTEEKFGVILDLRYATTNNVCNKKLYSKAICYLHQETAEKLSLAVELAKKSNLKIKIFDGFRPLKVQQFMFDQFPSNDPNGGFVSNPKTGSIPHCRGVAIDLTLVDENGKELEMGSDFDEFSELAFHNCKKVSDQAQKNRIFLLELMTKCGFDFYSKEWWHYQLFNARNYPIARLENMVAI